MTEKKDEDKGRKDADDKGGAGADEDDDDDDDGDDDDEAGWNRMSDLVGKVVEEKLSSWSGPQEKKTTSSRSPRKAAPKKPERKKGFLSGQFFSGLDPKE